MDNFTFHTPTKVFFGKGTEAQVGDIVRSYGYKKVLVHFGGQSAVKSGLLARIEASLAAADVAFVRLGGVQPNPTLQLAREGIALCREEKVDFILAVGGGSVIDSAKCIADGVPNAEDVWTHFISRTPPAKALPVGTVLTLAASGSEMSASCVISNMATGEKRGYNSPTHRALFSVLNPELTYTVSKFQTGCGTVDIMMHTLERYFGGTTQNTPLTDRVAEALLVSVKEAGTVADKKPCDYEARATLMWAGSLSHNDLTSAGRSFVMQVHQIEHEISGMYPAVAHGAGLSALFCSWARFVCPHAVMRFAQYAQRVWGVPMDFENPLHTAQQGIDATEQFFASLGMPTHLRQLDVPESMLETLAVNTTFGGTRVLDGIVPLDKAEILAVLKAAY